MLVMKVPMKNQPKIRPVLRVSNVVSFVCAVGLTLRREPCLEGRHERQVHARAASFAGRRNELARGVGARR